MRRQAMDIFRENFKEIVKDRDVSIRQLADDLNMTTSGIYNIINDRAGSSVETADRIAKALGYTLSEFIRDPNEGEHSVDECFRRVAREWKRRTK